MDAKLKQMIKENNFFNKRKNILEYYNTEDLKDEGIARELVNRIQNIRKEKQFEVTDKISVIIEKNNNLESAVNKNYDYICAEILAISLDLTDRITEDHKIQVELTEDLVTNIIIDKQLS